MERHETKALEEFQRKLNEPPPQNEVKVNKMANNSNYLPISFVQMKLDELFYGLWETKIDYVQVIANEIIGHGTLTVTHPVTGGKIVRAGAGAVMIQFKSEKNGGNGNLTDASNKITNTLVKDYPHLYAEITKSGAKTLGKIFGRDLNREHVDNYNPYSVEVEGAEEIRKKLQTYLDGNVLPTPLHQSIEANLPSATHTQLLYALEKVQQWEAKQIQTPVPNA